MTHPTEAQADIVERLLDEADLCQNEGAEDIATLLSEAAAEITRLRETVRRVQSAAKTIMIGEADELRSLREQRREWHLAVNSLDSEREANAVLTSEVELLRAQLAEAELRGVKAGLGAALKALKTAQYDPAPYTKGSSAIRAIDPTTLTAGEGDHG